MDQDSIWQIRKLGANIPNFEQFHVGFCLLQMFQEMKIAGFEIDFSTRFTKQTPSNIQKKAKSQTYFSTYAQRYAAGNGVSVRTIFFGGSFHICFFQCVEELPRILFPTALDILRDHAGKATMTSSPPLFIPSDGHQTAVGMDGSGNGLKFKGRLFILVDLVVFIKKAVDFFNWQSWYLYNFASVPVSIFTYLYIFMFLYLYVLFFWLL